MARSAIVVGSGAGGSVAAFVLARAGWDVLVLEKGRNLRPGLGTPAGPRTLFSNDEVKAGRYFEDQDIILEPRTQRSQDDARNGVAHSFVGDINTLPTVVGGGTIHWDGKTPRFWKQDFKGLSLYGPIEGATVADWPLEYEDLAPYYDEVERFMGVQGPALEDLPERTREQAPRKHPFPMKPNPPMYAGKVLAEGAARLGYTVYPFPMAVNSRTYHGRPRCNSCGFCSYFGCPIDARGGALIWLHDAMLAGAKLRPRSFVYRVDTNRSGTRATGVSYLDQNGRRRAARADVVILAPSPIETARLLLLSRSGRHPHGLGNRSGLVGRNLMFHNYTTGIGIFDHDLHGWRGPAITFTIDDFVGPVRGPAAAAAGLPWFKGGACEVGGSQLVLAEAKTYSSLPHTWGINHKNVMRTSVFRRHASGLNMMGEDLPQPDNRVDLDPQIRDVYGFPVPRVTYSSHQHETAASLYFGPLLQAICQASPGVLAAAFLPLGAIDNATGTDLGGAATTRHIMGTCRMGNDPRTSVVDRWGRMHQLDNVYIGDGSVFVSSGGFNPTLTIMALSLRMARHLSGR